MSVLPYPHTVVGFRISGERPFCLVEGKRGVLLSYELLDLLRADLLIYMCRTIMRAGRPYTCTSFIVTREDGEANVWLRMLKEGRSIQIFSTSLVGLMLVRVSPFAQHKAPGPYADEHGCLGIM